MEAVVSFNDLKQAVKVMGSITDITEKATFEKDSMTYKDKISFVLNSSLNGAFIYDIQTKTIEYQNGPFLSLLGYKKAAETDHFNGDDFISFFAEADRKIVSELIEKIRFSNPGQTFALEYGLLHANNSYIKVFANHTIFQVNDVSGEAEKILINFFSAKH
jgi:two-component system CheB/CheR fusion protein